MYTKQWKVLYCHQNMSEKTRDKIWQSTVQPVSTQCTQTHTHAHTVASSLSTGREGYRYIREYSIHTMRYKGQHKYRVLYSTHTQLSQGTTTQVLVHPSKPQHTGEQKCIRAASGSSRFNHSTIHLSPKPFGHVDACLSCTMLPLEFNTLWDSWGKERVPFLTRTRGQNLGRSGQMSRGGWEMLSLLKSQIVSVPCRVFKR